MRSHRGTRALIVLSLLAVAFMAAAGAADAKKHKKKHPLGPVFVLSASGSGTGLGAILTQTATCPGKARAIGGGFKGSRPTDGSAIPLIYESQKVGQKAWRVSSQIADVSNPAGTATLTAFVLCRRNAPKTGVATATVPTPETVQVGPSSTASCPPKGKVQAGGFLTDPPLMGSEARNIVLTSAPVGPSAWQSTVLSVHTGSLTTFAYCARRKKPLLQVSGTTTSTTGSPASHAVASCTGLLQSPQAGGFSQSATAGLSTGYVIPYESDPSGKDWSVFGFHAGPEPVPLTATALCG